VQISFVTPDIDLTTTLFMFGKSNTEITATNNFDKFLIIFSLFRDLSGDVLIDFVAYAKLAFVVAAPRKVLLVTADCYHVICSTGDTFN
jgi:hypothetical protein